MSYSVMNVLAEAGIDLAINAHTHQAAFLPTGAAGNPYPIANGGAPEREKATVMVLEADPAALRLRILSAEGLETFAGFEKVKPRRGESRAKAPTDHVSPAVTTPASEVEP